MFLWRLISEKDYSMPTKYRPLYQYKSQEQTMSRTETALIPLRQRASLATRITSALIAALARRRDRQRLGHLDPHLLRDIGLDVETARQEAAKPCWQP
jgi:uncharacterized protein YjiS (DUF1127 family)